MKDQPISEDMLFKQLEDALEERQTPDRRKDKEGLPQGVQEDRRKIDRRNGVKK